MLRAILGISKHSRAFRKMMIQELKPLTPQSIKINPIIQQTQTRSYSEVNATNKSTSPINQNKSKFESSKDYIKKAHIENSKESEQLLKILRKTGAISVVIVFVSIGYAAFSEYSGKPNEVEEIEYIPNLSQDIRYKNKNNNGA
ncbi:uncharacterized protein KGF55_000787 [Candida pseudojiufengensis]|uniref:uncharacterized protein n=1 Tax=Candida pseudojiufengensis TaxID=497109 RepID=UPI0022255B28|nr:uncharacterized protein KGF55_000787 [Candida pseudojiufengensis]KAI5966478.1 hypothetical protein KGF55_000787 [Candida pseudojiufengensis]